MEYYDRILLETRFNFTDMSDDERNACLNALLNTKELANTPYNFNTVVTAEIVEMRFVKVKSGLYLFNGSYSVRSSDEAFCENRMIHGDIRIKSKSTVVFSDVTRLMPEESFEFDIVDRLTKTLRKTEYQFIEEKFRENYVNYTDQEIENYLNEKIAKLKL